MKTAKKSQEDLLDRVEEASELLGLGDRWYARPTGNLPLEDSYGACASCRYRVLIKTRYNIKVFRCNEQDILLHTEDPVIECTSYEKIGTLTLQSMVSMAHLIDVDNKIKPGFC